MPQRGEITWLAKGPQSVSQVMATGRAMSILHMVFDVHNGRIFASCQARL